MIYGKLPVVLLSTIASEKIGSTNSQIAQYILSHIDEFKNIGIKEMAEECHVAVSSISRFCKEIGLNDFNELKYLISSNEFVYEELECEEHSLINDYAMVVNRSVSMVEKTLDIEMIEELCKDIHDYQSVSIFGLLKAGSVAFNLQSDLMILGKQVYTNISYTQQMEYILNSDSEDLIIIFSYTGSYFDYKELRNLKKNLYNPKIWFIGCFEDLPEYVDHSICFESYQDQLSHPFQLQFVANVIAQVYSKRYK